MAQKDDKTIPERTRGFRHVLDAAGYSYAGFRRLFEEAAFRQELLILPLTYLLYYAAGLPLWVYAAGFVLVLLTFAVEALNSAIEVLVDRISPEWSQAAKDAKDLGSFAVACLLAANAVLPVWAVVQLLS